MDKVPKQSQGASGDGAKRVRKQPKRGYFAAINLERTLKQPNPMDGKRIPKNILERPNERYKPEYIWSQDFFLQKVMQEPADVEAIQEAREKLKVPEAPSGFLSLSRKQQLFSADVSIHEQLMEADRKEKERKKQQEEAQIIRAYRKKFRANKAPAKPSRIEKEWWARTNRYIEQEGIYEDALDDPAVPQLPRAPASAPAGDLTARTERIRSASLESYYQTQQQLMKLTQTICFAGTLVAFGFGGEGPGASFALGGLGSIIYLRMLNRSMNAVKEGEAPNALSQPRLLIPVVLLLGINRFDYLQADNMGFELSYLPAIVGFFGQKVAIVWQQILLVIQDSKTDASELPSEPIIPAPQQLLDRDVDEMTLEELISVEEQLKQWDQEVSKRQSNGVDVQQPITAVPAQLSGAGFRVDKEYLSSALLK